MYIKILNVIVFEADVHSVTVSEKTEFHLPSIGLLQIYSWLGAGLFINIHFSVLEIDSFELV